MLNETKWPVNAVFHRLYKPKTTTQVAADPTSG